jgi:hypothetical protein
MMKVRNNNPRPCPPGFDEINQIIWKAWPDLYCHCPNERLQNSEIRAGIRRRIMTMDQDTFDSGNEIFTLFAGVKISIPFDIWIKYKV